MEQNDFYQKNFSNTDWLVYGVLYPLALIATCAFAELLQRM